MTQKSAKNDAVPCHPSPDVLASIESRTTFSSLLNSSTSYSMLAKTWLAFHSFNCAASFVGISFLSS